MAADSEQPGGEGTGQGELAGQAGWAAPAWPPPAPLLPPPPPPGYALPPPPRPGFAFQPVTNAPSRRSLVWETRFVMVAFLVPGIAGAVVLFAQHVNGVGTVTRFPVYVAHHPVTNLVIGILAYLPVASIVPLALFLLNRTGQPPRALGIGAPSLRQDIIPALGLIAAAYGCEFVLVIPLVPLLQHHSTLINQTPVGHVPGYYVIWGLVIAATTSIAEEVLVNGYLLTRLSQLGWTPTSSLILSLSLRTSYHIYYGVGFILTIPLGYFVTRSFQKHGRLNRAIAAHFIFDTIGFTIGVLT